MTEELDSEILSKAATIARGLAIDAVHQCSSGHLGLPLGCAEIGAVLFGHDLGAAPRGLERLEQAATDLGLEMLQPSQTPPQNDEERTRSSASARYAS